MDHKLHSSQKSVQSAQENDLAGKSMIPPKFKLTNGEEDDNGLGQGGDEIAQFQPADAPVAPPSDTSLASNPSMDQDQALIGEADGVASGTNKQFFEVPISKDMTKEEAIKRTESFVFKGMNVGKVNWTHFKDRYKAGSVIRVGISSVLIERMNKLVYMEHLPEKVKIVMKYGTHSFRLKPEQIDRWYEVAKWVEGMDEADLVEFASRAAGGSADVERFAKAMERFQEDKEKRSDNSHKLAEADFQISGMEGLYKLYKQYLNASDMPTHVVGPDKDEKERKGALPKMPKFKSNKDLLGEQLDAALEANGFTFLWEFEQYIQQYKESFLQEAVYTVLIGLRKYQVQMVEEGKRYGYKDTVAALHTKLGGFREDQGQYEGAKKKREAHDQTKPKPNGEIGRNLVKEVQFQQENQVLKIAEDGAKAKAEGDLQELAPEYPIFRDHGFSGKQKLDRKKMAAASQDQLQGMLTNYANGRVKDVEEAIRVLTDDPEKLTGLGNAIGMVMQINGIQKGSIQEMIISDMVSSYKSDRALETYLATVVALSLTILSGGAASPVLATAAAAGSLGMSAYMTISELNEYADAKHLSKVGLTDDPSLAWLVVALVGNSLDIGQAVAALEFLKPAARALNIAQDTAAITKAGEELANSILLLEKAGKLTRKAARAVERAKEAKIAYEMSGKALRESLPMSGGLTIVLGGAHAARMAAAKMAEGVSTFSAWLADLRATRALGKANFSPAEIKALKNAWKEGAENFKRESEVLRAQDAAEDARAISVADNAATANGLADDALETGFTEKKQYAFAEKVNDMEDISEEMRAQLLEYNMKTPHGTLSPEKVLEKFKKGEYYEGGWRSGRVKKSDADLPKFTPTDEHKNNFFAPENAGQSRDGWKRFMRKKYKGLAENGTFVEELVKDLPGLATHTKSLEKIIANGNLDKFNIVRAIRNTSTSDWGVLMKRLENLDNLASRRKWSGVAQVLGDLAAGDVKQEGAEFMLRVIDHYNLWNSIAQFEANGMKIGRRYDLVGGGVKWEFKSRKSIDMAEIGAQIEHDAKLLNQRDIIWVFDANKIKRAEVLEKLTKIVKESAEIDPKYRDRILANLERLVTVF